jgi:hypothetical protein
MGKIFVGRSPEDAAPSKSEAVKDKKMKEKSEVPQGKAVGTPPGPVSQEPKEKELVTGTSLKPRSKL